MKISGKYVSGGWEGTEFSQEAWGKDRAKHGKEREEKFGELDKCQSPSVRDTRRTKGNGRRPIVQAIVTTNFLMSHG